ncbi:putative bifunctional diguanylate cyclase/phosphodiesterase [Minwuia sp.]|uniref:putative bifunctional diguanylate cyclase/phosphodiesterase n=1 Tax=Minwuia sp. TaxID=2493630 RepID=UPI003A94535E
MSLLEEPGNDRIRILYVDDDYEDFLLTEAMLQSHARSDYSIDWASDFDDGIEILTENPPDACLVDYSLGKETGLDFVRRAKNQGFDGPMILLTGHDDSDLDQQALAAGAVDYLEKNAINASLLARAIRYAVHRKRIERELSMLASNDHLTGLRNRASFDGELQRATASCTRTGQPFALLLLDIDHFKQINDSMGHQAGDMLLIDAAARLVDCCREIDVVSRWGGDEFAIIAESVGSALGAATLANRIVQAMGRPFECAGMSIQTSASVGIVYCTADLAARPELLSFADQALYRAKAAGRNGSAFFDEEMNRQLRRRLFVKDELEIAVQEDRLNFMGQPLVRSNDGRVAGIELLARLNARSGEQIAPDEFIRAAEESEMIWALTRSAFRHAAEWYQRRIRPLGHDARISVNLSPKQICRSDAAEILLDLIEKSGAEPRWLDLEITENGIMADIERTRETLARLRRAGLTISLDDFGAGQTSLSYLARLPIDRLKIDRSFVSSVTSSMETQAISESLVKLANRLGIETLAEGVETRAEADFFRNAGCETMQGYYFGKPAYLETGTLAEAG